MKLTSFATAAVVSAVGVAAHGYVDKITIGSTTYTGYQPYSDPYYSTPPARIVRKIPGNGPVENLSLIDVQCNGYSAGGVVGSAPAPLVATVAAGSDITLTWTTWPDTHMGPLVTYLARVPSGQSITSWSPGNAAVWFKIHQDGYSNGQWGALKLLTNGSKYTFKIPASLAPGQYLVRHEIIALHAAYAYPGAQVYPSCIQLQVTGSGTKTGPSSGLVSFPGAYTANTPGIVWDAYQGNNNNYPVPGPAVWSG
ncbi:Esterase/lipase/thioesterase [Tulasnella sp. 418]|nr:Esterase/lipase/thioesterase [Tulasnella sp. 418]